eukprot:scaffold434_cov186-Pinguiococcus_pyrenoidosus.AAC.1
MDGIVGCLRLVGSFQKSKRAKSKRRQKTKKDKLPKERQTPPQRKTKARQKTNKQRKDTFPGRGKGNTETAPGRERPRGESRAFCGIAPREKEKKTKRKKRKKRKRGKRGKRGRTTFLNRSTAQSVPHVQPAG